MGENKENTKEIEVEKVSSENKVDEIVEEVKVKNAEEVIEDNVETKIEEKKEIEKKEDKPQVTEIKQNNSKEITNIIEEQKESKHVSKKKTIVIIVLVIALLIIGLFFSTIFALVNINNTNIIEGVSIEGIDVSKQTIEETKEFFYKKYEEIKGKDILLKYEDFETVVTIEQIGTEINIEQIVDEAYKKGRDGNIFINNFEILNTKIHPVNLEFNVNLSEENMKNIFDNISFSLPGTVVQSSYSIDGNDLIITNGTKGVVVQNEELKNYIITWIKTVLKGQEVSYIGIPVEEKDPEPINIDQIHEEIYKEPQNAYIQHDPFQLFVHSNGVDFDVQAAKEQIKEYQEEYVIGLSITEPEITVEKLGEEAFPDVLGSFSTNYGASASNRGINIAIAANTINGTILLPGEVFSYNQVVGDTTPAKGYTLGGSYLNGELVQSYGGGICQVSSTLYNAVLYANLDVVLRYNHSSAVGYVAASRDATVSYGGKDFQFRNSRQYPIKIVASATNGVLKVAIHGIEEEEEYEVVIESQVTGTIPFTTKYEQDPTLPEGQQVVKSNGSNGKKSVAYKVLKLNGVVVSRTLLSQDTYNPMQRIVRVGTK